MTNSELLNLIKDYGEAMFDFGDYQSKMNGDYAEKIFKEIEKALDKTDDK